MECKNDIAEAISYSIISFLLSFHFSYDIPLLSKLIRLINVSFDENSEIIAGLFSLEKSIGLNKMIFTIDE